MIFARLNALIRLSVLVLMVYSSVLALRHPLGIKACRRLAVPLRQSQHLPSMLRAFSTSTKPDFSKETKEKYFDFNRLERDIYNWWEVKGMFKPDVTTAASSIGAPSKKPFVIPMPPPNVTGYLHMGHAIFVALQDIMARFHRMRGRPTLWLPGT